MSSQETVKHWCDWGHGIERKQVNLANCRACDKKARLPPESYHYCTSRKPYHMQITEYLKSALFYLKYMWESPRAFRYALVSGLFQVCGLKWGYCASLSNGKWSYTLLCSFARSKA